MSPEPSPGGGVTVAVVRDLSGAEALSEPWGRLAETCRAPRSMPEPILAWYRRMAPAGAVCVVAVRRDGDLVGVLPLAVVRDRWRRVVVVCAAERVLAAVQPLVLPGAEAEVLAAFAQAFRTMRPVPDVVRLESVDGAAALLGRVAPPWAGRRPKLGASTVPAAHLDLVGRAHQDWLDSRVGRTSAEDARRARRLAEAGYATVVVRDGAGMSERLGTLRDFYLARRDARGGFGADFGASMVAMLEELFERLGGTGRLVMFSLEGPLGILAVSLALVAGGRLSYWMTAVGDREPKLSPGFRLHLDLIQWATDAGLTEVDLGPGLEPYKERISTGLRALEDATLVRTAILPVNSPATLFPEPARERVGNLLRRMPH